MEMRLEQEVELRLEHYAKLETDEQANHMTFLHANPPEKDSEQQDIEFKPVKGGKFPVHARYGALQVNHFCYMTIGGTKKSDTSK